MPSQENLPFVSVCLLTYNRAHNLPLSIDSLLAQTHADFELIINDDRSPDQTEEICREYERKDPRVRYFKNDTNLRYADNQNAAISRANSDYVAIVHDGDVYRPDLILKWTKAMIAAPNAGLVFNGYHIGERKNQRERDIIQDLPPVSSGNKLLESMLQRTDSPIWGIVMVRKSAVQAVGEFDRRFPTLADIDMWMRLLAQFDVAYVAEPLITISQREKGHHNNPGNIDVRRQLEHIYMLNGARFYGSDSIGGLHCRKVLVRNFYYLNFRSIFWCLKRGELIKVLNWMSFYLTAFKRYRAFWNEGLEIKDNYEE